MRSNEKTNYALLLRATQELVAAQPWLTLQSTDIFAVQAPESGEQLFIQISGGTQEPLELMAYRGMRGLEMLWELNNCPNESFIKDQCVDVPALLLTFVDADSLDEIDRAILEDFEPAGMAGFPVFRACKPGFQPGHPTADDVQLFAHVILQVNDVIRLTNEGEINFTVEDGQEDSYVIRIPEQTEDGILWKTDRITVNLDDALPKKAPKLKSTELSALKELPQGQRELRADIIVSPYVADDSAASPSTFLFTIADNATGEILCARIDEPGAKLPKFRESLLDTFQQTLMRLGERPVAIHTESYSLCDTLGETLEKLDIRLMHHELKPFRNSEREAVYRHLATRYIHAPATIIF